MLNEENLADFTKLVVSFTKVWYRKVCKNVAHNAHGS
jgi:hypothetical protein